MSIQLHTAIILAAGKNTRFDTGIPKSLQQLGEVTLLERQIRQLHRQGIRHVAVVTGHRADVLESYLAGKASSFKFPVSTVFNPDFERPNGRSILAAKEWIGGLSLPPEGVFLCTMADHVFSDAFFDRLMREVKPSKRSPRALDPAVLHLAVDMVSETNLHIDVEDVTKVTVDVDTAADDSEDPESVTGAAITAIGKQLKSYSYYDTGCFVLQPAVFDAVEEACATVGEGISDTVTLLARRGQARVVDVSGVLWNDVDTPEDFDTTRKLLGL